MEKAVETTVKELGRIDYVMFVPPQDPQRKLTSIAAELLETS